MSGAIHSNTQVKGFIYIIETCQDFMHIDGETHIDVPEKRRGYIHYNCGRWHVVKVVKGRRYSLGTYDTVQEAASLLQEVNQLISKSKFEAWYKDYKITLMNRHDLHLTEAKRKQNKK